MLAPLIEAHLRVARLADSVWEVRATLVGVPKINFVAPQSHFALPVPNGSLPNLPVHARADLRLQRTVQLAAPLRSGDYMPEWRAEDRALVEATRQFVAEV